ncbi:C6 transcription factor [Penicillium angulare]|uniref:C6 transcription factor n=1 Tax=Penicillium angulare TaxID=116970 RepID=A0A9W9GDE9_9EURO|nr:C6 transcription factor [Penicillium angulare]
MSGTGSSRIACNLCRHRKIRCDKAKPACETCRLARVPCVFNLVPQKKNIREQLEESKNYVRQLENALREKERSAYPGSIIPGLFDPSGFETSLTAFRWHLQYCTPGVVAESQLASIFDFDEFARRLAPSRPPGPPENRDIVVPKWPSRFVVEQAINHYSKNKLYAVFPAVQTHVLTSLLNSNALYENGGTSDSANKACLVAFTAFMTRTGHRELAFTNPTPDAYLQAALSLVPHLMMEHTNLRALETFIILGLYIAPLGQPQTAELLLSMAIRILYNLRAHKSQPLSGSLAPHDFETREHLRALFWLCYSIDKEMSLRKCQAPMINDEDCDLDLPATYVTISSDEKFFTQQQTPEGLLYASDLRLVLFKSKVYRYLYSHESLSKSEVVRLQLIRELDHELHELKSQFPTACQPHKFAIPDLSDTIARDISLRVVNIHFEYYHCLIKIHGASLIGHGAAQGFSLPSSSSEICYQAARSSLLYLSRVRFLVTAGTFWIYAQFLLTAVLALYRRLVTYAGSDHPHDDVRILEDTLSIFQQLKLRDGAESFPPFTITEALIQHIINLVRG